MLRELTNRLTEVVEGHGSHYKSSEEHKQVLDRDKNDIKTTH